MQIKRPLIGISTRLVSDVDWCPSLIGSRATYIQSVITAGGGVLLIPLTEDREALRAAYDAVHGILLPGGEDVDPKHYGEAPHPRLGETSPLRDDVELQLARWAFAENKPLLGLCRGAQVMNVALGGTLFQDLPSQFELQEEHRRTGESSAWTEPSHDLVLKADSLTSSIVGDTRLPVNSLHHQAVKDIADKLVVVGSSDDGVVEAIESPEKRFFIGLQCHPESLWQDTDNRWLRIFEAFVTAARATLL